MTHPSRTPTLPVVGALSLAVSTALFSTAVAAQERMLEEIVVTAQKRAENAQDVPVALTAISADMIEKIGITQTQDLVKLAPSLTFTQGDNKQNSGFRIRGVGTDVFSIGVEQSVAIVVDDVSTVQQGQSVSNLVDVERIEILRGPQSTLFGKSASAGLVNIVTKAPAAELEGSIEATVTDDDETRLLGSISGPITDALAYRLTGHWSDRDGFVDNLSINDDVNDEESQGLRGRLQWQVTDTVQADLIAYYSEDESTISALTWLELDPDAMVFGIVPGEIAPGITPSDDNLDFRSEDGPEDETDNSGGSLRLNVELGDFSLTSITAYDNWEYTNWGDVDFSDVDVVGFFTGGALSGGFTSISDVETDFFSQEFRLASPDYDNFNYLVGLYYADVDTDRGFLRNPGLPVLPASWDATSTTESYAVFSHATYRFSESVHLTGGLRYNYEEISVDFVDNLLDPLVPAAGDDDDSEVLGNLSLQYFLNDDVMFYGRYARGYKGQAYDISSDFSQEKADNPVAPETSDAFEVGVKSTLMDGRLQLNATAFYTEYDDYQAQSSEITEDGDLVAQINNVGSLETKGVELETVALVGENLTLSLGASYTDATIDEFENANCYEWQTVETGCIDDVQDLSGADLPNSPEWKYSILADYQMELESMPFYGFMNLSWVWQDEVTFDLEQNPLMVEDSYGVGNLSIGINEKANDRYRITAFVNNFTDENYRSSVLDLRQLYGGLTSTAQAFSRNSQRYYGLRVKLSF